MLKRHRANKRARQAAKNLSTPSTTTMETPTEGAATHPKKRLRQNSTQQEDLRVKLKQRVQNNQPPKRPRIDPLQRKSSHKEAQKARTFYKAFHERSLGGQTKKRHTPPPPPPAPSCKPSRPVSPQPSTSSSITHVQSESFFETMKQSIISSLNLELLDYAGKRRQRHRSPFPHNDDNKGKDNAKGKGKGKGKGKRD